MTKFTTTSPEYEFLRRKWMTKHANASQKLLTTHSDALRNLTLSGIGGLMLLANPTTAGTLSLPHNMAQSVPKDEQDPSSSLAKSLETSVPKEVRKLSLQEEEELSSILSEKFGLEITPEIDGIRLNRSYGLIGGEQHLYRYPGDTVFKHADTTDDWAMYGPSGIAPGLGAWGYFAHSESSFTDKDKEREKWYIAVQTFLAPGFAENVAKYRDFFKYRKMLVVNSKTGQAVVTDIGDAGPAEFTGKSLGGSPEVMHYLGLAKGPRKGPVLYFFIDDPEDKVPLGPISPVSGGRIART
jgi:hypothetical protein